MKTAKVIIWSILAVLFIALAIRESSSNMFFVDDVIEWMFRIISFGAAGCIIWFFVKDVLMQKKKTK